MYSSERVRDWWGAMKWSEAHTQLVTPLAMIVVPLTLVSLLLHLYSYGIQNVRNSLVLMSEGATSTLGAASTSAALSDHIILSESFLHESNMNTTMVDLSYGEVRAFRPHGTAYHLFIHMSTYRSGPQAFSTSGLMNKEFLSLINHAITCEWRPLYGSATKVAPGWRIRPVGPFPAFYETVVVICNFGQDVGTDRGGGELVITVSYGDIFRTPEKILALTEAPGEYNASMFEPPFKYDYVYCGSPVYGDVSPQRVREWIAYHAHFFGERSHFFLYDVGGMHADVLKVLQPWVDLGRVSIQNLRQAVLYPETMHYQSTAINDCAFRSQFLAKWSFFFDIDEYLYVAPFTTLPFLLAEREREGLTLMQFFQKGMSPDLCLQDSGGVDNTTRDAANARKWLFEKHVFSRHWKEKPPAWKYAAQGRYVWALEIHGGLQLRAGSMRNVGYDRIWFHHYHATMVLRNETCRQFVDPSQAYFLPHRGEYYSADFSMANVADSIKMFELATIGKQPFIL